MTETHTRPADRIAASVIIPAYNASAYIGTAIESVLRQTEQDFELIVVDDGSSDDTLAVVQRYDRVRGLRQGNAGVSAARNRGVRESSGEFVVFLDADDQWHPDKLRLQLEAMRRHPDILICRTTYLERESEAGWPDAQHPPSLANLRIDEALDPSFLWPYFCTSSVMVRRAIFDRVGGFSTALRVAEDVDFYLRVLAHGPQVAVLTDQLVFKRVVPGSLGDDSIVGYVQLLKVYERYLLAFPHVRGWLGDKVVDQAFRRLHFAHACSLFRSGRQREAREALGQAARLGWGLDLLRVWLRTYLRPDRSGRVKQAPQLR